MENIGTWKDNEFSYEVTSPDGKRHLAVGRLAYRDLIVRLYQSYGRDAKFSIRLFRSFSDINSDRG